MSILEKIIIFGNIAKDMEEAVIKVDSEGIWARINTFEEISAGVKDFEYSWYGECMKKGFIKDGIRIFTIYSSGEKGYEPKPVLSDEVYEAVGNVL